MKVVLRDKMSALYVAMFLVGVGILLYPTISNMWNNHTFKTMVSTYESNINGRTDEIDRLLKDAEAYNDALSPKRVPDAFAAREGVEDVDYEAVLNINSDGMMGYIDVPAIKIEIPIYHYTSEEVLKMGVGHLAGSSIPVGGRGTHAVLSAHRGLPKAKLFTDLNLMVKGDAFFIHVLDRTLKYEVDQILIVKPNETDALAVTEGEDLVTLVTCTPYGINTERLLVRGHRVPFEKADKKVASGRKDYKRIMMIIMCILAGAALAYIANRLGEGKRKNEGRKKIFIQ